MTQHQGMSHHKSWRQLLLAVFLVTLACNPGEVFINNTTSLGGASPGTRGNLEVAFINNTPYFASFTFGVFDPLYETLIPESSRFAADADPALLRLERNSTSDFFPFTCGRVISVGDHDFIEAIRTRDTDADLTTLQEGITFSDLLLTDPDVQSFTVNNVNNQTQLLGVHYQCESRVIFTFELDSTQPKGIRIDVDVILQ